MLVASSSPALVTVLPVSMVRIWPVATLASMVPPISLSSVRSLLPLPMLPSPEMTLLTLSRVWPAVVAMIWLPAPSETAPSAVEPARVSVPEAASTSSVSPEPASRMPSVPGVRRAAVPVDLVAGDVELAAAAGFDQPGIADGVLNVEDAGVGRLQQPGIGDGVAGVDGQDLAGRNVGVDGAADLVVERQIAAVADAAVAGDDIVDVVEGLAGGGGDDLAAGAERDRAVSG